MPHKLVKKKFTGMIHFKVASTQHSRKNLTKEVKYFRNRNTKIQKKEGEEHNRRREDITCSWIGKTGTIKMSITLKEIHRLNKNPY